jgi:hypothetical protein
MKERISEVPIIESATPSAINVMDDAMLSSLGDMSKEELITLIRRICGASGGIELALMTQDEIKDATRLRLAGIAIRNPDDKVALQAIQQLLDRIEGKPVGSSTVMNIGATEGGQIKVVFVSPGQPKMIEN